MLRQFHFAGFLFWKEQNERKNYWHINLIDDKIYIGQSIDIMSRFYKHKSLLRRNIHTNQYLQNAINKYNIDNFFFEIQEQIPFELYTKSFLTEREKYWVNFYENLLGKNMLYNIANPVDPHDVSEKTREKLSNIFKRTSPEDIAFVNQIFELRSQNLSYEKIAKIVGRAPITVQNVILGKKRKNSDYQQNYEKVKNIKISISGKNHYGAKISSEDQLEVNKIFDLRARNLTYKQISQITGYSKTYVASVINGKKRNHNEIEFLKNKEKIKDIKIMKNGLTKQQYQEKIDKILKLKSDNLSIKQIIEIVGWCDSQIRNILKKYQ